MTLLGEWYAVRRSRKSRGDGIFDGTDVLHGYARHVVVLDLAGQVYIDLDPVLHVLLFDRVQERVEPLGGAKVADHPLKVDLGETFRLGVVEVAHAAPDRLGDRGQRSDTDTGCYARQGVMFGFDRKDVRSEISESRAFKRTVHKTSGIDIREHKTTVVEYSRSSLL